MQPAATVPAAVPNVNKYYSNNSVILCSEQCKEDEKFRCFKLNKRSRRLYIHIIKPTHTFFITPLLINTFDYIYYASNILYGKSRTYHKRMLRFCHKWSHKFLHWSHYRVICNKLFFKKVNTPSGFRLATFTAISR